MNKQQLASKIWASANKMRSKIEANEYKDYILGFIFYKFVSDRLVEDLRAEGWSQADMKKYLVEENDEMIKYCQDKRGYFIAYNDLFSTWIDPARETPFTVGDVRDALNRFARLIKPTYAKVYAGIFDTLQNGLSKLGDNTGAQTKSIVNLLDLIKDIPTDGSQDYDVLGFIYEYLISNFAANAGKKAGEFYTPHEVALMMSEIVAHHLRNADEIKIYDPTSGSGSLLLNIGRSVGKFIEDKNKIVYYAQELKEATYNLTRMNLVMRGILPDNIVVRNGDTLEEDWPWFDDSDPTSTYDPLYCDAVVSNPPYSQEWSPKEESKTDPRYKNYGVAPQGTADFAFLLHDLYHVKPGGIMTIVLPHGVLFRGGSEEEIRKNLIERNNIDAIIGLPANIFFGTGIPTIVMVLKQKRYRDDILIVDASKGFQKVGKNNQLRARDIRKIVDAVTERREIPKFSRLITRNEVRENGYNLNIPRYVNSADADEQWDIYATMFGGIPNSEIDALSDVWTAFPSLRSQIFEPIDEKYSRLRQDDIDATVNGNAEFTEFLAHYNSMLKEMPVLQYNNIFEEYSTVNANRKLREVSNDLFKRMKAFEPIIDSYAAYQLLEDHWRDISGDLEILQSEGLDAARIYEPKYEIKKKDGKDVEVQVGYVGRVLPLEIVQEYMLPDKLGQLEVMKNDLVKIQVHIQEILSAVQEDESIAANTPDWIKDDMSAFVPKDLKAECKAIKSKHGKEKIDLESLDGRLIEADKLLDLEKKQKKAISQYEDEILHDTFKVMETLSDDDVFALLHAKHIVRLEKVLSDLPMLWERDFLSSVKGLADKYGETLVDIDRKISESEQSLASLIDNLTGSDHDMAGLREFQKLLRHE